MFPLVNTREPAAVLSVCRRFWLEITGRPDGEWLTRAFAWVQEAFAGEHPDYEPLDTRYHDLEHTLQGTLCLVQLLAGWHRAGDDPRLDERAVRLALLAILLHDTGYLKARGDHDGTGAKFTPIHVQRSAEFAGRLLAFHGFPADDTQEIQSMIRCTGVNADIRALRFLQPVHRKVGAALATADLLGQMAAPDYVDKLPVLFSEFAEAAARGGPEAASVTGFSSADELIRRTPAFFEHHVLPRLKDDFGGVYLYLNDPWPAGPNPYLEGVLRNIARIRTPTTPPG